jgi:hypothetical protein
MAGKPMCKRSEDHEMVFFEPGDYWGTKYETRYDRDVTAHWAEIRVNKYRW